MIALFSDIHMMPGLHVTLLSMLRTLDMEKAKDLEIFIYLDSVPQREKELLRLTHESCHRETRLHILDYSPKSPNGKDLLHGNATAYGRINLAHLLPQVTRCIYLDCDLIINRCVTDLFSHFDGENILFADGVLQRKHSLDKPLFERAGLDMEMTCFNSGVMGIDLALWREKKIDDLIKENAEKFHGMLASADQALLNVTLHQSFKPVGADYNTALYPSSPAVTVQEKKIYHFVGSPKPWDFLGRFTSNHHPMWKSIYKETAISAKWPISYSSLKRTIHTSKQSIRAIKAKITPSKT